jgi:CheY-like chemotaxis protein
LSTAPSTRPAPPEAVAAERTTRRVLVVDDNRDAAESLAILLRAGGHDVRVAYDGPSALGLVRESPPEAVLLDIGLPGMSGYDVARALCGVEGVRPLLIALTGYGQHDDRERAHEAGFDLHFVKPVDLSRLERALATLDPVRA